MKILNVLPSSGKSKGKAANKILLGFEKVNLEVVQLYGISSTELLREVSKGRTTIETN